MASEERYHYMVALWKMPHLFYNTSAQNGMTVTTEYIIDIVREWFWLEKKITVDQCKNTEIDAKVYMNKREDNNFQLINEAKNSYYKDWAYHKERYLDTGGYCFKVID